MSKKYIIHVVGPVASGKTTLAKSIKSKSTRVSVFDLDDVLNGYIFKHKKPFNPGDYQKYIDNIVSSNKKRIIVFVGFNKVSLNSLELGDGDDPIRYIIYPILDISPNDII